MIRFPRILTIILFVFQGIFSYSQDRCGTVEYNKYLHQIYPFLPSEKEFEYWIREKMKEREYKSRVLGMRKFQEEIYIIPVVVHVIHNGEEIGEGANISDEQILSQIEVLNEDYRRLNPDTVNTFEMFKSVAADAGIEFRLALRDPFGNATNGIVRVRGEKSYWDYRTDDSLLKSQSFWPPEDYLNIWVCDLSILGYSQYPVTDLPGTLPPYNRETDGVVIDYKAFGSAAKGNFRVLQVNYDRGRTATHEIGHFLSLRHIWGDGGCEYDDYCDDTPLAEDCYFTCDDPNPYSCGSRDMYENYLDYTYDRCMNIFTQCQKSRMRTVLENSPRRASLLSSPALIPTEGFENDLYAREIITPSDITCHKDLVPSFVIQNIGKNTVTKFKAEFTVNGQPYGEKIVEDSVNPLETLVVNFQEGDFLEGEYLIEFRVKDPNDSIDANPNNNSIEKVFLINSREDIIPFRNRFVEGSIQETGWSVYNPDGENTWELKEYQKDLTEEFAASMDMYNYTALEQEDWLISPVLDFSEIDKGSVFYDYSYAQNDTKEDILEVLVSTNCGVTFPHLVYTASGDDLAIFETENQWRPKLAADWERNQIILTDFAGYEDVRIGFKTTNGNGNTLYLDNIEFFLSEEENPVIPEDGEMTVFPNPAFSAQFNIAINLQERDDITILIMDITGKIILNKTFSNALNQTFTFDLSGNRPGLYLIKTTGKRFYDIRKLILIP